MAQCTPGGHKAAKSQRLNSPLIQNGVNEDWLHPGKQSLSSGPKLQEKSIVKWKCDIKTHESFCLVWLVGDFFSGFLFGVLFFFNSKILSFTA